MAAKKAPTRKTITTTVEEPTAHDASEELDAFDRARLEFSGAAGVKLTIYRYDDGEVAYLKRVQYTPETIDEEWIRKRWGAGSFQLRFVDENGARQWSRVIHIAADTPPSSPTSSSPSSADHVLEMLRRQNEIMLQGILARAAAPASSGGGGGMEAIVALIQGMQSQNAELLRASLNRPDISSTILTVLEKGMSIAADRQFEAEGGWLAQVARIAKEVLPTVSEIARARATMPMPGTLPVVGAGVGLPPGLPAGAPVAPPPASPTPGAPVNGAPASPNPSPPASSPVELDELVRNFAPSILEAIANGAKPEDVADEILRHLPPAFYTVFDELTPERAIRVSPAFSQHRDYIEALVASLKDTGEGEEEQA